MNKLFIVALSMVFLPLVAGLDIQTIGVGEFGYHPSAEKKVIVYGTYDQMNFEIHRANGGKVFTGKLERPRNYFGAEVSCQGGQSCVVGDFSSLTEEGEYYFIVNNKQSRKFKISRDVYQDSVPIFLEFFNTLQMQNSSYHGDWNAKTDPLLRMIADGANMMDSIQTSSTLIRLGSAYQRNPELFSHDKYTTQNQNVPDMEEYILAYSLFLADTQDSTPGESFPEGWLTNFGCWAGNDNIADDRWTSSPDPCLHYSTFNKKEFDVSGLLAYLEAIPALYSYDEQVGKDFLGRAIRTEKYLHQTESSFINREDEAAFYGASLFLLYDYTGDQDYLQRAYFLRDKVSKVFISDGLNGNEFYWEEYIRHKGDLESRGLQYNVNGNSPESFFTNKLWSDYKDSGSRSIDNSGERVFQFDPNIQFQNSKFILSEAVLTAKSRDFTDMEKQDEIVYSQLAFLSGANGVQRSSVSGISSMSFLLGIGNFPTLIHSRFFNRDDSEQRLANGLTYIPGWIVGVFDNYNDLDGIYDYSDTRRDWQYTESTNEMVANAIELVAYMDAQDNNRQRYQRFSITDPPVDPPQTTREIVKFEAESAERYTAPFVVRPDAKATGNAFLIAPNGAGENGEAVYKFELNNSGDYYIWARTIAPNGMDDSFFFEINWGSRWVWDVPHSSEWKWNPVSSGSRAIKMNKGWNEIKLIEREDGTMIDAFVVTNDPNYVPTDSPVEPPQNHSENETSETGLVRIDTDGGLDVVLLCKPEGSSNDLVIDWNFGDGKEIYDTGKQVNHNYASAGNYYVQCDVWDNSKAQFSSLGRFINVGGAEPPKQNETEPPQEGSGIVRTDSDGGLAASFLCAPEGASSDLTVDWNFGDGKEIYDDDERVNHVFASAGNYYVQCGAWDNQKGKFFQESRFVSVSGGSEPPEPPIEGEIKVVLSVAEWFPQGLNVIWVCSASGGDGNYQYDFFFGDESKLMGMNSNNVYHTYSSSGAYSAKCVVNDNSGGSGTAQKSVNV